MAAKPRYIIFKPKLLPSVPCSPFETRDEDILLHDTSDDDSDYTRDAKRQKREAAAQYYLRHGQPMLISTAQLKGPFRPGQPVKEKKRNAGKFRHEATRTRKEPVHGYAQWQEDHAGKNKQPGKAVENMGDIRILASPPPQINTPSKKLQQQMITLSGQEESMQRSSRVRESSTTQQMRENFSRPAGVALQRSEQTTPGKTRPENEPQASHSRINRPEDRASLLAEEANDHNGAANTLASRSRTGSTLESSFQYVPTRFRRRQLEQLTEAAPNTTSGHAEVEGSEPGNFVSWQEQVETSSVSELGKAKSAQHRSRRSSSRANLLLSMKQSHADLRTYVNSTRSHTSESYPEAQAIDLPKLESKPSVPMETEIALAESRRSDVVLSTQAAFQDALADLATPIRKSDGDHVQGSINVGNENFGQEITGSITHDNAEVATQELLSKALRLSVTPRSRRPSKSFKSPRESLSSSAAGQTNGASENMLRSGSSKVGEQDEVAGPNSFIDLLKAGGSTAAGSDELSSPPTTTYSNAPSHTSFRNHLPQSPSFATGSQRDRPRASPTPNKNGQLQYSKTSPVRWSGLFTDISAVKGNVKQGKRKHGSTRQAASQTSSHGTQSTLSGQVTKLKGPVSKSAGASMFTTSSEWQDAQRDNPDVLLQAAQSNVMGEDELNETIKDIQGFLGDWTTNDILKSPC